MPGSDAEMGLRRGQHRHGPCPGARGLCGRTPSCSPNFCFHVLCSQQGREGFISSHPSLCARDGGFPQQGRALSAPPVLLPLLLHPSFLSSLSCYIHPPGCRRHPRTTDRGQSRGGFWLPASISRSGQKKKKGRGLPQFLAREGLAEMGRKLLHKVQACEISGSHLLGSVPPGTFLYIRRCLSTALSAPMEGGGPGCRQGPSLLSTRSL